MRATKTVTFTTLLADTILEHGPIWTWNHCRKVCKVPAAELHIFFASPPVKQARKAYRAFAQCH